MLVCNVSLRPLRSAIAADLAESAAALDASTIGQIVFATLVDDPASVNETIDAYLGLIMLEAVSAADATDATTGALPTFGNWNPLDSAKVTLSNANLTATTTGSATPVGVRATAGFSSGKKYFEATIVTWAGNGSEIGLATASAELFGGAQTGQAVMARGVLSFGGIHINSTYSGSTLGTRANGDIIGIAVDLTAGLIWFRVTPSGNWNGSGTANPATAAGGISLGTLSGNTLFPLYGGAIAGEVTTANFGASAFNGAVPSGFNAGWS
jgi:hypothetical protein